MDPSDGRIGHAELDLAPGITVLLSAEYPELGIVGPQEGAPVGMSLQLHVRAPVVYTSGADRR